MRHGFYLKEEWEELLDGEVALPDEIPGDSAEEKRANYAALLASQLRVSYPTAVVSEMVKQDVILSDLDQSVKERVTQFLDEHQGRFELGLHPVEQYLGKNEIALDKEALTEIKRLQRVYQITPSDEAMAVLMNNKLDSAYAVVRYDEQRFVDSFKEKLGGETVARLTYTKAQQVHNAVLNIATSYMLERVALPLHAAPRKTKPGEREAYDSSILAYPTLEGLFGEMDYCACEHCRSWLSPAAYLVDLLQFLDPPASEKKNPLEVLLEHRPDIQYLQLTCENTNTVLPYIDLVNEVLEHWVVNGSLATFKGHNIETGVTTEELLASPQFVSDTAYEKLKKQLFPLPLPFHRPLEITRRYFAHFDVSLCDAMEWLRPSDNLERPGGITDKPYAWRDILMERLGLSRQEYRILTDSTIPLQTLYGEDPGTVTVGELISHLTEIEIQRPDGTTEFRQIGIANAKLFARRLNLSYEELIEIVHTQFMGLIKFSDPAGGEDICSFDTVEFRYARPDFDNNELQPIEFLKLLRFVRLWKKLGWSIEQTDKAIKALYPTDQFPAPEDDWDAARTKLDMGFQTLLIRLAHLQVIMKKLNLNPETDLLPLLACWSSIDTHGSRSLYRRMFLNPTILALDSVFQEDGYGNYLADRIEFHDSNTKPKLTEHSEALRAAFNLTGEEFDLILHELGFDRETALNIANISAIFRHSYLARRLRLSVRELLALKALSGLDPFEPLGLAPPDSARAFGEVRPPAIRFIELAQQIKASAFKVSQLVYFLQHEDWSGKSSPSKEDIHTFARTLRSDLLRIEEENAVQEDITGEVDFLMRLKRQQVLETISARLDVDLGVIKPLLEDAGALHAMDNAHEPSIVDFLELGTKEISTEVIQSFRSTYVRLLKALAIAEVVGLSGEELVYFATHEDFRIGEEGWLNVLAVEPLPPKAKVQALFGNLLALIQYGKLKEDMNISDERLLESIKDPQVRDEEGVLLIEQVTAWREVDITALLGGFGLTLSNLGHLRHFARLHEAFRIVKKLGIGASTLLRVTTNEPDIDNLRDLQAALLARYDDTPGPQPSLPAVEDVRARGMLPLSWDWLKLIQPINDELRILQRDALVAYVLHKMGQNKNMKHIDTPNKLFEYFLIDVEMDPCMKTSRIKQAISSVQLFIQRCLMNLEPDVASSYIDAGQWEWMKRYRVWEANRKVFLWPENWLEPELRDNKTSFFSDLESELLQGDITDDAAATALVHYLEKLDEVAKLEICGMYYEENELDNPADDVVHVIARTAGARRTYYYRRQEGGVTWTPWEKIDLNIEDNPVLPVVWKGRLFIFWVSVLQEAFSESDSQDGRDDPDLIEAKLSQLKGSAGEPRTRISLTLYWSEYYNGKWQTPRTSDVNHPLALGEFPALRDEKFDRSKLTLSSSGSDSRPLFIYVGYPGRGSSHFKLYNTHSLPLRGEDEREDEGGFIIAKLAWQNRHFSSENGPFIITYESWSISKETYAIALGATTISPQLHNEAGHMTAFDREVLGQARAYDVVWPRHELGNIFSAPFFFQDRQHVFFVCSEEDRVWVWEHLDFGTLPPVWIPHVEPPLIVEPDYHVITKDIFFLGEPIGPGLVDPGPVRFFIKANPHIHRAIGMSGTLRFGERLVGPGSSMRIKKNIR